MTAKYALILLAVAATIFCSYGENIEDEAHLDEEYARRYGNCSSRSEFQCVSQQECIPRSSWCDGKYDCYDDSDEKYCNTYYCPYNSYYSFKLCDDRRRCIPSYWVCDGVVDCLDASDEKGCPSVIDTVPGVRNARINALYWMKHQNKKNRLTEKWSFYVPRIAVALHLADDKSRYGSNQIPEDIAYEVEIQLLANLLRAQSKNITSGELAILLNALLVTCVDPRNFHGMDIVDMLRKKYDSDVNLTNAFVPLVLCNAGDEMTTKDVERLVNTSHDHHRPYWTETTAQTLMALTCINQSESDVIVDNSVNLELANDLKNKQQENGGIENVYVTALVTQALIASGLEKSGWDVKKAVKYILNGQERDGSFGTLLSTYYVLPLLKSKTLLDVNSDHCNDTSEETGEEAINDLRNRFGPKIYVRYNLWIGDDINMARMVQLRVPANSTLLKVMEFAAKTDPLFRFKYSQLNGKPYVYNIANIQDDPESNKFWFLYSSNKETEKLQSVTSSPVDVIPKDKEEFILWYKTKN